MEQTLVEQVLPVGVVSSLASHIEGCFTEAKTAKQPIIERLLACERQRAGHYEPKLKATIVAGGGQEIFMKLTDIKCRAADSWIRDVVLNHAESTWAMAPTPEPDLAPELMEQVTQVMIEEAAQVAAMGIPVDRGAMVAREAEIAEETKQKVMDIARLKADNMEKRIGDKLTEGKYQNTLGSVIYDFTTYPACIIKGPVLRKKKVMKWGKGFAVGTEERVVIEVDRVSVWDAFPSPHAITMQDGYFIQRHRMSRKSLFRMIGLPGSKKIEIQRVLDTYRNGHRETLSGESEHEHLEGRSVTWSAGGLIDAIEYWGPASGFMLKEWGLAKVNGVAIDEYDDYQINAWKIGPYMVRVQINPDPLDQRPYSKACFVDVPGSFWGRALPEMMDDIQVICNGTARAIANNVGIASGPQVEVQTDRLPPGSSITGIYPWKIWQTTSDRSGNGQPAIRFFQPSMNAGELLQIYQTFAKQADEVTGVPNYLYGSSAVSGAGRTASGLSMLMENAAKGIKHAILSLDAATSEVIIRIYNHLMQYDPDESIKGDMSIVPAGAIGAMIREQQVVARREIMAATANPIDAPIIGPEGRAEMLRESIKGVFTNVNKIVPDPDKMRAMAEQQAAMQAAQAQQGAPAPGGNTPQN